MNLDDIRTHFLNLCLNFRGRLFFGLGFLFADVSFHVDY
jgi:hypothetical protein